MLVIYLGLQSLVDYKLNTKLGIMRHFSDITILFYRRQPFCMLYKDRPNRYVFTAMWITLSRLHQPPCY